MIFVLKLQVEFKLFKSSSPSSHLPLYKSSVDGDFIVSLVFLLSFSIEWEDAYRFRGFHRMPAYQPPLDWT